ncbi:MAG: hypothetical protein JOY93_09905, partial [Acidobacteriales bacterium]|nr:hypothetical protein [Terriglobales bacterium]
DGDGFVEYARRGSKGLIQQGWKDSNDSIFHADGTLADAPIALCEVQGYVYAAKRAGADLSSVLGMTQRALELKAEAAKLQVKFEQAFWCPELQTYALALDGHKKPCKVRASNPGHCLYTGIVAPERAQFVTNLLLGPQFFTGWGIRTLGSEEARYNPLSYHNGSVWPHDNAIIAAGLAAYGFIKHSGRVLLGLLDLSSHVDLQRLPELFCGLERRAREGPTLYPVACSPQAWAAAAVFMVVQACLGISVQGAHNRVAFDRPCLPEGIPHLWVKGLQCGSGSVDLFFERQADTVRVQVEEKRGEIDVVANL